MIVLEVRTFLFLQANGFLNRDLAERIHAHLHVRELHSHLIWRHTNLCRIVYNSLYCNKSPHCSQYRQGMNPKILGQGKGTRVGIFAPSREPKK